MTNQQGGEVMAICSTHPALARIVNALGLAACRGLTIKADVDSVVMVQAEQYATEDQIEGVAAALEVRDYVLVPREEYDRLVESKDDELRSAVRGLLDYINDKYPDKPRREWTCPHMARLDELVPPKEVA